MALLTNPARSRQLAVGLLVAAALAVFAAVAIPVWMLHRHYDSAIAQDRDMLARYRRIAAARPLLTRELDAMRARDPRKFFLRSGGAALSAAEVQEVLRSLVESSGGRLISMQAPASKDDGHYRQVTVNAQVTANIFALRKILFAIESGTPFLFIDNLLVRTQVPGNFKPSPGAEPDMFVSFEIYGYALTWS